MRKSAHPGAEIPEEEHYKTKHAHNTKFLPGLNWLLFELWVLKTLLGLAWHGLSLLPSSSLQQTHMQEARGSRLDNCFFVWLIKETKNSIFKELSSLLGSELEVRDLARKQRGLLAARCRPRPGRGRTYSCIFLSFGQARKALDLEIPLAQTICFYCAACGFYFF
jgi:hypothetical protein